MKCLKCNNEIKSNLNVTFCKVCGEKIEINNNDLNEDNLKLKLDEYINSKEYDLALELAYNLKDEKLKYKNIIEIFDLYATDSQNVVNNYAFKNEYKLEAYKKLIELEPSKELEEKFNQFKEEYIQSLNDSIASLKEGINQKKLELEKLNSSSSKEKSPYFNQILVGCIIAIVLGIILGFVLKGKVVNIIGYVLAAIGVVVTIILAYNTPTHDINFQKSKIENQISLNKNEIKEVENTIEEIK